MRYMNDMEYEDELRYYMEPSSEGEIAESRARDEGMHHPDSMWMSSDMDTWVRNPHFVNTKPWLNRKDEHPEMDGNAIKLKVIQCNQFTVPFIDSLGLYKSDCPF